MSAQEILTKYGSYFEGQNLILTGLRELFYLVLSFLYSFIKSCGDLLSKAYNVLTFDTQSRVNEIFGGALSTEFLTAVVLIVVVCIGIAFILNSNSIKGSKIIQNIMFGLLVVFILPTFINSVNGIIASSDMGNISTSSVNKIFSANIVDLKYCFGGDTVIDPTGEVHNGFPDDYDYSLLPIHDLLLKKKIRVVDLINDESSSYICYKTEECLHKLYDTKANCIEVEIGNTPCESCYNLCLIHEKKFFKEIPDEDSYSTYTGMSIQHITIEKFQDFVDAAINSVVHELLIKDDIANQKISLYDWPSLNLSSAVDFGVRVVDDKKTPHFFFINILPDGSFSLFEKTLDLFGSSRYDKMILALQGNSNDKGKSDAPHILGAVCGSNEHINTIWNTPNFTLPNFSDIHKELASGNTFLRGKEYKETLFSACLDIKYFEKDGAVYYFVGKISQNVGYKFHVAANIRKIVAFRDHPLFFTSLLPLMNITFVHNGQLSAIPFPFKYLREYIASVISLPIEEDDNDDSDDTSN